MSMRVKCLLWALFILPSLVSLYLVFSAGDLLSRPVGNSFVMNPEYENTLDRVVVSLDAGRTLNDYHIELLQSLPEYTEIFVLLPEDKVAVVKDELHGGPFAERARLIPFDTERIEGAEYYLLSSGNEKLVSGEARKSIVPFGSLWAQDLFVVAQKAGGGTVLLLSDTHKWFVSKDGAGGEAVNDNGYVGRLAVTGADIKRLSVTFSGGNIMVDVTDGRSIAFVGGDVVRLTRTVWAATREHTPSRDEIIEMLRGSLNVDAVAVVSGPEGVQPDALFHLDQALMVLPGKVAAVTRIIGEAGGDDAASGDIREVRAFLSGLRALLLRTGYEVYDVETYAEDALNYEYHINAVPYVDAKTGRRTILMPVYNPPGDERRGALVQRNAALFESLGYDVIRVPSRTAELHGGIHCLLNVLG